MGCGIAGIISDASHAHACLWERPPQLPPPDLCHLRCSTSNPASSHRLEQVSPCRRRRYHQGCPRVQPEGGAGRHTVPGSGGTVRRAAAADRVLDSLEDEDIDRAVDIIEKTRLLTGHDEALASLRRYVATNAARIVYKTCRQGRLPAGSGMAESACKQIVQTRHKQAGMWWNRQHARRMLNAASFIGSHRWDEF